MPSRQQQAAGPGESHEYLEALERLTDELRVLRDVFDEIREHLSFAARNPQAPDCGILRQMGRDPTADNWGEQLVIVHGKTSVPVAEAITPELQQARDTIRELLGVSELNLDELEDDTRDAIQRAGSVLRSLPEQSSGASATTLHPAKPASSPISPDRLF